MRQHSRAVEGRYRHGYCLLLQECHGRRNHRPCGNQAMLLLDWGDSEPHRSQHRQPMPCDEPIRHLMLPRCAIGDCQSPCGANCQNELNRTGSLTISIFCRPTRVLTMAVPLGIAYLGISLFSNWLLYVGVLLPPMLVILRKIRSHLLLWLFEFFVFPCLP